MVQARRLQPWFRMRLVKGAVCVLRVCPDMHRLQCKDVMEKVSPERVLQPHVVHRQQCHQPFMFHDLVYPSNPPQKSSESAR